MEDRQTYTYKKKNKSNVNVAKLALLVFAVIVLLFAAIAGVRTGTKKAEGESAVAASKDAANKAVEQSTVGAKYSPGNYKIQTGGYTLLLRESPSKNASDRGEIPDKTVIKIVEISEAQNAADKNYQYWGKTEFAGETGWVPMGYLHETDEQPTEAETKAPEEAEEDDGAQEDDADSAEDSD